MLKAIIAIIGMLITGFIVWKLLQWQGDATDEKGNLLTDKARPDRSSSQQDSPDQ